MPLSSFILVEICVLRSSGWLAVYYSTPGALKVQGLAARKVTTGSPLNSCKLLAGFGEAGKRGGKAMAMRGLSALLLKVPLAPPSLEGIPSLDAGSSRGHWLYSSTAWPLWNGLPVGFSVCVGGGVVGECRDPPYSLNLVYNSQSGSSVLSLWPAVCLRWWSEVAGVISYYM